MDKIVATSSTGCEVIQRPLPVKLLHHQIPIGAETELKADRSGHQKEMVDWWTILGAGWDAAKSRGRV